jgi:hypothetical protein
MDEFRKVTLAAVDAAFAGDIEALCIARMMLGHLADSLRHSGGGHGVQADEPRSRSMSRT